MVIMASGITRVRVRTSTATRSSSWITSWKVRAYGISALCCFFESLNIFLFTGFCSSSHDASAAFVFILLLSLPYLFNLFSSSYQTFPCLFTFFIVDNAYEIISFFQKPINTWRKPWKAWWFVIFAISWLNAHTSGWLSSIFSLLSSFCLRNSLPS